MKIGILKENHDRRVALIPATLAKNAELVDQYLLEKDAGQAAGYADSVYGELVEIHDRSTILQEADLIVSIHPPSEEDLAQMKKDTVLVSLFQPYFDQEVSDRLRQRGLRAFSLDMIPRTTLAQAMDVLSSMASIAGYQAVLLAANHLPRYFPMMITAAGSIRPAKVLVLGAGVAGLQAIATAKRLGAMVEAFDVRKAAKEEVESLGAKFVEVEGAKDDAGAGGYAVDQSEEFLQRQQQEVQNRAAKSDVIITTAQIRGRKAPILVRETSITQMKPGSVIVDLASSTGGNCELTEDKKTIQRHGVTIIGNSNLAETMPQDASTLFSNNLMNFLRLIIVEKALHLDFDHEIIGGAYITPTP